jgi:hypothetical protein
MLCAPRFSLLGHIRAVGGQMGSRRVYTTKIYTETALARLLSKMGIGIRYAGIMCCAHTNLLTNCIIALPVCPMRPRTTFAFPPISDDIRRPESLREDPGGPDLGLGPSRIRKGSFFDYYHTSRSRTQARPGPKL